MQPSILLSQSQNLSLPFILALLFGFAFISEVTWTLCVQAVQRQREVRAGLGAAFHALCVLSATWLIVEARTVCGAAAYTVGVFLGAYIVVRFVKPVCRGAGKVKR